MLSIFIEDHLVKLLRRSCEGYIKLPIITITRTTSPKDNYPHIEIIIEFSVICEGERDRVRVRPMLGRIGLVVGGRVRCIITFDR